MPGIPVAFPFDPVAVHWSSSGNGWVTQINAPIPAGTVVGDRVPAVLAIGEFQSPPIAIAIR
ncbi:MAG: hypothetical protein ACKV22_28950 [Bryobacteraceae bacterium]